MGERDDDLVGAAGAGGAQDGVVLFAGLDEVDKDFTHAGGEGEGAAEGGVQAGGVRRAGEDQHEEVEEEKLERARNADAVLPPCHGGGGARADRRPGLG